MQIPTRYDSVEVRWFMDEWPIPAAIVDRFSREAPLSRRTDHYLSGTGDGLGIKWREGLIEIKQRTGAGQRLQLRQPKVEAATEHWTKWSFALPPGNQALQFISSQAASWVAVDKERYLLLYEYAGGRIRKAESDRIPLGCALELSRLKFREVSAWGLCLEAFGRDKAAREKALRAAFEQFFSPEFPIALPANKAMGYPAWLKKNEDI